MKRKLSFLLLLQLFCTAVVSATPSGGSAMPSNDEGSDVIVGLILGGLMFLFVVSEVISIYKAKKRKANAPIVKPVVKAEAKPAGKQSDEVYAAIAMAIYAATEEVHDVEETVLTIRPVARTYSPWSSKIYGLREVPKR